jgi:hypothetical protein
MSSSGKLSADSAFDLLPRTPSVPSLEGRLPHSESEDKSEDKGRRAGVSAIQATEKVGEGEADELETDKVLRSNDVSHQVDQLA